MQPKDYLSSLIEHDRLQLQQFGLLSKDELSLIAKRFITACYLDEELTPQAIGAKEWADGIIDVLCNELADSECQKLSLELSTVGHARLVKVRTQAATRANDTLSSLFPASMVVLLFRDATKLIGQWKFVEERIRPGAQIVTASFDDGAARPQLLGDYPHFNVKDGVSDVASSIIDHYLC
ncbi:hypothetical protein XaraCFBP7407_19800 [Xanthomonas arboricola pv. arracaciae]|nr:hypothetical protein XaraCFBP7407_19800 [Xanthomonas arboricola pv. arracaciae]